MIIEKNKRIKVLQVLDKCAIRNSPIHGVSRLLLTWWPGFEDTDIELSLAVFRGGNNTCSSFTKKGIIAEDLNRGKMDPRTIIDLVKIIKRDGIDILHCHGYGAPTFGRIAGFLTNTPVIVHEHMIDDNIPGYQRLADWFLSPFTAKGIAISDAVKTFMVNKRAIPKRKMEIIYNSIPNKYFQNTSPETKFSTASKYKISTKQPVIGIVGRLDPVKGHTDFLNAAKIILSEKPDVQFLIIGDGEIRAQLEEEAKSLLIENNIKFLGHIQDVHEIVSLIDILAICSHQEGFSLAAIEAMALGKPVVATEVGGLPEVVDNDITGILVGSHNPAKLAEALLKLLNDKQLVIRLGENGKNKCKEFFSLSGTVNSLTKIYRSVYKG